MSVHKYFLIPAIIFFLIIALIVIYLQFFYLDWKWDVLPDNFDVKTVTYQEKVLDESCDDDGEVKIIKLKKDIIENRLFADSDDITNKPSIHSVYLLPCDVKDRKFDINNDIHLSIQAINNWFLDKTKNQIINFDKKDNNLLDTTFIRVNKSIKWFTKFNTNENKTEDASSKIEKIILSNQIIFRKVPTSIIPQYIAKPMYATVLEFIRDKLSGSCLITDFIFLFNLLSIIAKYTFR